MDIKKQKRCLKRVQRTGLYCLQQHFYMQGGICYEKMSFSNKTIMKMMSKVLDKKKNKDSAEKGFAQAIKCSYDIKAKEYAEPLIKYLLEG